MTNDSKCIQGSFNVRVQPEVHQRAALLATMKGISLNQLVQKAIEKGAGSCVLSFRIRHTYNE